MWVAVIEHFKVLSQNLAEELRKYINYIRIIDPDQDSKCLLSNYKSDMILQG
jgi:hypothetical protein